MNKYLRRMGIVSEENRNLCSQMTLFASKRNETKKNVRIAIDCLSLTHLRCAPFGSCNATNTHRVSAFSLFSLFVRVDAIVWLHLFVDARTHLNGDVIVCVFGQCETDNAQPEQWNTHRRQ